MSVIEIPQHIKNIKTLMAHFVRDTKHRSHSRTPKQNSLERYKRAAQLYKLWPVENKSAPIFAWKCNFPPLSEIMTDRSTDDGQTGSQYTDNFRKWNEYNTVTPGNVLKDLERTGFVLCLTYFQVTHSSRLTVTG